MARYRFSVIRGNLKSAFQYNSDDHLKKDIDQNYRFLAKIIRQTILHPTPKLLHKRMSINRLSEIDRWLEEGKSVIVTMGHIGNWEWAGVYLGLTYPGHVCALYKRIKNETVHNLMMYRRKFLQGYLVEAGKMNELLRHMKEKPLLILMIADQNPGNDQGIIWDDFFNQKTAFVSGPETLATKYNLPVVYLNTIPDKNGNYQLMPEILVAVPSTVGKGTITHLYVKALEKNIIKDRSQWLWSHKRWKRTRATV